MSDDSSSFKLPERMRAEGRPENQRFTPDEPLFCRLSTGEFRFLESGNVYVAFRVDGQSVNRSWPDGQWDDVLLYDYPSCVHLGVIRFPVGDIPTPHLRDGGDPIHYGPVHDPEAENYYHSEIRGFRATPEGERLKNFNKAASAWFRAEMAKRLNAANVLKYPGQPPVAADPSPT